MIVKSKMSFVVSHLFENNPRELRGATTEIPYTIHKLFRLPNHSRPSKNKKRGEEKEKEKKGRKEV